MTESREESRGRQLYCRVITPQEMIYDGESSLVIARIADGEIGVMVDHAPLVSSMETGDVRIKEGDDQRIFATSDGFFKVSENLVQILVEEAVPVEEIDTNEAEDRVEEAERELSELQEGEEQEPLRQELERRRRMGENLARVARRYGEA